ncbi:MAG TPA: class I SAM-dependent methyltransferase [Ilumatobacteraceae bacterium]|jgi:SAM-dependent methyltransferase|nr:class I SAM-dependent methyltransferase [Ilumatobacteraceae bacterium]
MTLRFHEISESRHRVLNPFTVEKLRLLGHICVGDRAVSVLDLCCGKAEMLCTWAVDHDVTGVGVDISEVFLAAARERADELHVADRIELVHAEAAKYAGQLDSTFDVVSCIGATWIGGGLIGTLDLMRPRVADGGLVVVGEPYWVDALPEDLSVTGVEHASEYASLVDTLDRIESAGFELVEMVLANSDDWDRYVAAQWMTVADWLVANPDDPDAAEIRQWIRDGQRSYLAVDRRYFGWGVFVMRV